MDPKIKAVRELQAKEQMAARLDAVETKLDALDEKLEQLLELFGTWNTGPAPKAPKK